MIEREREREKRGRYFRAVKQSRRKMRKRWCIISGGTPQAVYIKIQPRVRRSPQCNPQRALPSTYSKKNPSSIVDTRRNYRVAHNAAKAIIFQARSQARERKGKRDGWRPKRELQAR